MELCVRMGAYLCPSKLSRIAVAAMLTFTATVEPLLSQAPAPPAAGAQSEQKIYSLTDLEYLLSPIALYPDPLLALILPASAFPLQLIHADRWISANPDAVERSDFSQVDRKYWDSSVQALVRFPSVIEMLVDHLEWTESLGEAFAIQPDDVAAAIQLLRAKAENLGNLKSSPEQTVLTRDDGGMRVIYISPASPERIYVPVYDPSIVFVRTAPSPMVFATGVVVGSLWNNRWGWHYRRWNDVWINNNTTINVHRPRPDRPGNPGAWRPDRPGPRPDRPGSRPDRPRPDRPGARPDRPDRPDRPIARPDRPGDRPVARPDRPPVRPDRPIERPDRPVTRPERPATRPDIQRPQVPQQRPHVQPQQRPQTRPQQRPQARPQQRPQVQPQQRPQARPQQRPQARPQQRPQARPQQRPQARPQQNVRSQRPQGARPQRQR